MPRPFFMISPPLLSICIPTFNRSEYLDPLLESLARQIENSDVAGQVEVVISDNTSTDSTQNVGEKWADRHSFIRYFRNAWNIGGDSNQIRVVERASGQFVWLFGDDDRVREHAVTTVMSHLHPGVSQLFLDYRCMIQDGVCMSPGRLRPDIPDDITTVELVKRLGFITAYSLITSHVFDRQQFLSADPQAILRISPWYAITSVMIMAFHDRKCVLVRQPVVDFTMDNDRLPDELVHYVRVIGVLNTLRAFEAAGAIDSDFLYGCYESGAGNRWNLGHYHYFREEIYGSLAEMTTYWALPGRVHAQLIRDFIDRGPGFWDVRNRLKGFFLDDYEEYRKHQKPIIHYWRGKAWFPAFSLLLSSDREAECAAFDALMEKWPEEFVHESILISRLAEDTAFENVDVFMAPFQPHVSPSASLCSGFRKTLTPRVLIFDRVDSPAMPELIKTIDEWQVGDNAPDSCLLFEAVAADGMPTGFLGLYLQREPFVLRGGFENYFEDWPRRRLLADAGFRLGSQGWALQGGRIAQSSLARWFQAQLPGWLRLSRTVRKGPFSEHGLNINLRGHLERLLREKKS
jgi:glycosyltransferase involved in cell wall biosynthesis